MPIVPADEFKSSLKPGTKLLGLDISKSSIGIGFADIGTQIVTPVTVIARKRLVDDAAKILKLMAEYGTTGVIVGWPLHMDGSEGKRCQAVKDTVLELAKSWKDIKITFQDERLSTAQADRMVEETVGNSRKNKGKPVDAKAAMVILQAFLDQIP